MNDRLTITPDHTIVIPAKAGIQPPARLDSRFRGNDEGANACASRCDGTLR